MDYMIKSSAVFRKTEQRPLLAENLRQNQERICAETGCRFAKISLSAKIKFETVDNKVRIDVKAVKGGMEFDIAANDFGYVDYVVIGNAVYFMSFEFSVFNQYLTEHKINVSNSLSFKEFMSLTRYLQQNNIRYEEDVISTSQSGTNVKDGGLKADLFEYQKTGSSWLKFMYSNQCGCILADEMGLGKTLQIISLIGSVHSSNPDSRFLIVAPVSLLENWRREINRFYPSLSVKIHYGKSRSGFYKDLLDSDITLTAYSTVHSDMSMLNMIDWDILVLDEAQYIKNPDSNRAKDVKRIRRKMGIAVTGTPFENHMTDLWSLVDFVLPSYLGKRTQFEYEYDDDIDSANRIEKVISPIMLRRKVKDVADDLPPRIDIPHPILMTDEEASYYEEGRKAVKSDGELKISLGTIQKLRMFCTHPLVYKPSIVCDRPEDISNKYSLLCQLVDEIVANNEKVLIFTSFNEMSRIIYDDFRRKYNLYINCINGSTQIDERQNIIDMFSSSEGAAILILNPKAAGTGLNIASANHVIHYNLEWNPAVEDQASARAYRRGQTKTVFVHRLFYAHTIDEVINDRIQRKRELSDAAIVGNEGSEKDKEDLIKALALSPVNGGLE